VSDRKGVYRSSGNKAAILAFLRPRLLEKADPVARFDCGAEELDRFMERYAFQSQRSQSARTHVSLTGDGKLAGFPTLAYGSVESEAPSQMLSVEM
jgi:hypothetical protein